MVPTLEISTNKDYKLMEFKTISYVSESFKKNPRKFFKDFLYLCINMN